MRVFSKITGFCAAALCAALACSESSTSPDGDPPPPPPFSIVADTTTLREAQTFGARLRGATTTDSVAAFIGGDAAALRILNDSTVEVLMALGAAGSTPLQLRVGRGATPRTASLTLTRVAAPAVVAPASFLDSINTGIGGSVAALEAQAAPAGVAASAWAADVGIVAAMADSLDRSIARLSPTQQAEAARVIAAVVSAFGEPSAALQLANEAVPECRSTRAGALLCLESTNTTLRQDLRRLAAGVALIGTGALLLSLLPPVGVVVAAYGVVLSADALLSMYNRVYDALSSPAILAELELPPFDELRGDALLASTEPQTFVPGAGQVVPLRVRARNPLPSDVAVPIVADLIPQVAELAQRWNALTANLPSSFQLSPPGFQSTVTEALVSAPEPGEIRVVSVSAPGVSAAVQDAEGGVILTLTGDPGPNGQDVTVTLAAGGGRAGQRTVALPLRYERAETVRLESAVISGPRCSREPAEFYEEWLAEDGTVRHPSFCQARWFFSRDASSVAFPTPFRPVFGPEFALGSLTGIPLYEMTITLARPLPAPVLGVAAFRNYRAPDIFNPPPLPSHEMSPFHVVTFCRRTSEGTALPTSYLGWSGSNPWQSCDRFSLLLQVPMIIGEQVAGNDVLLDTHFNLPNSQPLPEDFELYVGIVRFPGGPDVRPSASRNEWNDTYRVEGNFSPPDWILSNLVRVQLP